MRWHWKLAHRTAGHRESESRCKRATGIHTYKGHQAPDDSANLANAVAKDVLVGQPLPDGEIPEPEEFDVWVIGLEALACENAPVDPYQSLVASRSWKKGTVPDSC